jgi:hypothetical protein
MRTQGFARPTFRCSVSCFSKHCQASFCSCTLLWISKPNELTFGPNWYLFSWVPPQPNCPPTAVLLLKSEWCKFERVVFHWRLFLIWRSEHNNYHLHCTFKPTPQQLATVKFHGVFASHWTSLDFAPECCVRGILVWDNGDLVTPFMQVVI